MREGEGRSVLDRLLREVLAGFPQIRQAILFGSLASGYARTDSDLDIAVEADHLLTVKEKIDLVNALSVQTGRPVDLVDLRAISVLLRGQVLRHGRKIMGSNTLYGELISRHVFDQADFMPIRTRLLAERRKAWIGK
ncbi:MAG: nucleotidyltransferase domain-containing protein [Ferrovum sp.]|nr:nucleotidyltransferase domain-containing protein [Ferrovum sp.]